VGVSDVVYQGGKGLVIFVPILILGRVPELYSEKTPCIWFERF
jgi:hypothetical protein